MWYWRTSPSSRLRSSASADRLREHPAVTLDVLYAILALANAWIVLERRKDLRPARPRTCVVRLDVVDRDVHAVDDVRRLRPLPRALTHLRMMRRTLVVRARPAEHELSAVQLHRHVCHASLIVGPAAGLFETERLGDPVGRTAAILVGQHRDDSLPCHLRASSRDPLVFAAVMMRVRK